MDALIPVSEWRLQVAGEGELPIPMPPEELSPWRNGVRHVVPVSLAAVLSCALALILFQYWWLPPFLWVGGVVAALVTFTSRTWFATNRVCHVLREGLVEKSPSSAYELLAPIGFDRLRSSERGVSLLAVAALRSGRREEALSLFVRDWQLRHRDPGARAPVAYTYALLGDFAAAHAWLANCRPREPRVSLPQLVLAARGALPLTREMWNIEIKALTAPVGPFVLIGDELGGHTGRVYAFLSSFVAESAAAESDGASRGRGQLAELARGSELGEYDYLVDDWPELSDFVDRWRAG